MAEQALFDLYLSGKLQEGYSSEQVLEPLSRLFKQPEDKLRPLLSGRPYCIKRGLNSAELGRYQQALSNIGLITAYRDSNTPIENPSQAVSSSLSLCPSGSLVLSEAERQRLPGPDIDVSDIVLAPTGSRLQQNSDEIPVEPPTTAHLSLDQPGATLAEAGLPLVELNIDDMIAGMSLAEAGSLLSEPKTPPAAPPNTDHIKLQE